ncbi:N-acetyltransferase [Helicobacter magdeburgensis]|uniref:N-acetyltransferase n=1 Tax=Helicobacter magdeburgensis TaxID=471858 RepID=A0A4U8SZL5_9HELI|nr:MULTISPECIES: acyltransferase [Helicobacter]TLD91677.1 N-acetyltransferase [Helicobacter magdeburgensis]BDB63660.1 UDP-3-O-(3-hydroxymyristoyl)glucosamine N-acyltransferase [Helicobacter cinaedi]
MQILHSGLKNVSYGKNVKVVSPSNLYDCTLEDDVFVGPFCEIQSQVKIGRRTRIQSHSFICSLVEIGQDCFIGHGVMFINDRFTEGFPAQSKDLWEGTRIGNNVSIGSNATILPVNICDNVVIGAGAVVTRSITQSGIYAGNPASLLRKLPQENTAKGQNNES